MVQFRSFEETLALIGALAAAGVAYKLFNATTIASAVTGLLVALAVAYATFFEFTLQDDVITYRNRFMQRSFPLSWVEKVSMKTFWGGLPGHTFHVPNAIPAGAMEWIFSTHWSCVLAKCK